MKIKLLLIIPLTLTMVFMILSMGPHQDKKRSEIPADNMSWEKQLNEMNYLIMRTSAANLINGVYLTYKQGEKLRKLVEIIDSFKPPIPDMKGDASPDLVKVRDTYILLFEHLADQKSVPDGLNSWVLEMRIKEAETIKRSLLGAQKTGYSGSGCLGCHAPPSHFPKGDISGKETRVITQKERELIDKAHVTGLFGEEGMLKLWELRTNVDNILTDGQKYLLNSFRCCLLPNKDLENSTNIGQAFVTDEWKNYFGEVRKVSGELWKDLKPLYLIPVGDIIEATLPGIRSKDKKEILKKVDKILVETREMEEIIFEAQKESLCLKLKDALKVGFLLGETAQQEEERQFLAAMFLLFPGNEEIYDKFLKRIEPYIVK
ncbi:MAG: hypothetical protein ABII90_07240 [Bacteroidota bacterium]